ncbi:hypothetical protein COSO111634_35895 [Corallococcus soli]
MALQAWTWTSDECSYWRSSSCWAWSDWSQGRRGEASEGTRTRVGRVLMKMPTRVSESGSSGGLPATVLPKTTSCSPE